MKPNGQFQLWSAGAPEQPEQASLVSQNLVPPLPHDAILS